METATAAEPRGDQAATGSKTIADLLPLAVEKHGPQRAIKYKDESRRSGSSRPIAEVGETVRALSLGLIDLGIEKGDKVAILANTRPEWTYFDFAALSAGATVVPIYQTNSPEECQYVLENSDAKVVIVEDDEQLAKITRGPRPLPKLEHVDPDDRLGRRRDLDGGARRAGRRALRRPSGRSAGARSTPDDICTFIYTSGTTGPAEGLRDLARQLPLDARHGQRASTCSSDDEVTYLYLPLAHSFALLIQLGTFDLGATLAYWERDPLKIVPNLAEVQPTYFPSVPRIFEKIYTAATANVEKEGGAQEGASSTGRSASARRSASSSARARSPASCSASSTSSPTSRCSRRSAASSAASCTLAVSGAAPINPDILRFFDAAGVLVLEGWGMTETSTAATIATPEDFKFGTIGKPFPGCEVKIAEDGEILVKGPNVFQGYYKNEEATRETIVDGWLHTGDIGEIDSDGYLKITGRKKDIIITAGGKNITPANLEAEIKQHPLVSQCVVIGDRRPYLVALVTLDPEEAAKFAKENDLAEDPAALAENDEVRDSIKAHVDEINEKFARVEQVKKFEILPADLSQEGGELTPTMKVKRNVVADKYEPPRSRSSTRASARPASVGGVATGAAAPRWSARGPGARPTCSSRSRSTWSSTWLTRRAEISIPWRSAISLVAVVVAREPQGDRLEAVLGDPKPRRVVHDRGAEHQLVVGLGLDQDDVDAGVLLLPVLDRPVQAVVGDHPEGLVAEAGEAHVGDAAHAGAEDRSGSRLREVVDEGDERVDDDDELGAVLDRDVDVGGRADAAVDHLAALHLDRLVDDRQRGRGGDRRRDRHVGPLALARGRSARSCRGRWR